GRVPHRKENHLVVRASKLLNAEVAVIPSAGHEVGAIDGLFNHHFVVEPYTFWCRITQVDRTGGTNRALTGRMTGKGDNENTGNPDTRFHVKLFTAQLICDLVPRA